MIKINTGLLKGLLKKTQRKCHILGKAQVQVQACVLRCSEGEASTTSLVRDGKTSLSRFSCVCGEGEAVVVIPDIDRLLGVLNAHGESVSIDTEENKIRVKSVCKQTTLTANMDGLAFPHSRETIGEWESKSLTRASQIRAEGYFITKTEETRPPIASWVLDADDLYSALACDSINKQMLNRYTFKQTEAGLIVSVGDEIKGKTEILLSTTRAAENDFEVVVEGGLDNVLREVKGSMVLQFYDFTDFEQGIRLLLRLEEHNFVLQAGLL